MSKSTSCRPRVVTFVTSLSRGGAATALLALLDATRAEFEHSVVVLVGGGALVPDFRARGIPVAEIGLNDWFVPVPSLLRMVRCVEEVRADVVTAHMYHGIMAATFARRLARSGSPLFWTIHHSLGELRSEGRSTRWAVRACRGLSRAPNAIVYVSRRAAEQHGSYRFHAHNSIVIPNGYDFERFQFDGEGRKRLRTEWGFSDEDIIVGHVARVHPMKDHGNMMAALDIAMTQDKRLRAVFCGHATHRLSIPDKLRPRIRLLGLRDDMPQVMSACDMGCLSSSFGEAFPNVLAEFMACQRPCVTTDVGDAAEIVGPFGRSVPPRNATALAEAVVALSRLSEAARTARGEAARKSIADRIDIRSVAARHSALWREGIEKTVAKPAPSPNQR